MLIRLIFFCLFLFVHSILNGQSHPEAKQGWLDLRTWDTDEPIRLNGQWEFYWQKHLLPSELKVTETIPSYVNLPHLFHKTELNGKELGSFGYATYRLRILCPEGRKLAISYQRLFSASRIWINGKLESEAGVLATNRKNEKAFLYPTYLYFNSRDTTEIVIHISNFHHRKGGIPNSITLGSTKLLTKKHVRHVGLDSFLFGIVFIISFYQIGMFFFRRRNYYSLYFALFGLAMSIYIICNNEILITKMFPFIPWWIYQKINYLSTLTRVVFWVAFLWILFPKEISKNVVKFFAYSIITMSAVVLFTPSWIFTFILPGVIIVSLIGLIYISWVTFLSMMRKREGAWYTFIGTLAIIVTGLNDILYESNIIKSSYLLPYGVFVFFLMQSFMLAMHFSKSFIRAEELSEELTLMNENLESIVTQRTAEIEQQKEEIMTQRDQIELQRDMATEQYESLMRKNQEIKDSIEYAKHIQQALLPPSDTITQGFPDHFVFYKPRDVVSGDFYWYKEFNKKGRPIYVIAAADCTGHGVPGAFLSMLGISLLNEIVPNREFTQANEMLEEMRKEFKASLHQQEGFRMRKDGIDIALCIIDPQQKIMQYAGAYNPLFMIRNDELVETKAVPNPIGIHPQEIPFRNHVLELNGNDSIYIFSDGFVDQLGGPHGHKFMKRQFKRLLFENRNLPMTEQKEILIETIERWKNGAPQIDDILVFGMRIETVG